MTKTHQAFIEQVQREHQDVMTEMQVTHHQNMEVMKEEVQEYKVRVAELNLTVKNDVVEIQRLTKENDKA